MKTCILCKSEQSLFLFKGKDIYMNVDNKYYHLYQCSECKLTTLDPLPNETELKKYYPPNYKIFTENKIKNKSSNYLSRIKYYIINFFRLDYLKNNLDIFKDKKINYLDYGCGNGKNIYQLRSRYKNWNFFGYDKYNSINLNYDDDKIIFINNIENLEKIEDNFFDIINLSSVIEHVHDPLKLIVQLKKKLNENGLIIIKTPNFSSISRKIFGKNWHNLDIPRHLHIFSVKNLQKLLSETNLKKKKIIYSRNSGVEIKSIYNLLKIKRNNTTHKYYVKLFNPLTFLLSFLKQSSTITIIATKNEKI
jgi:SAM-dependent methyltransferase